MERGSCDFRKVSAAETPAAMEELHERFDRATGSDNYHPHLLAGCYVFDFLAIQIHHVRQRR